MSQGPHLYTNLQCGLGFPPPAVDKQLILAACPKIKRRWLVGHFVRASFIGGHFKIPRIAGHESPGKPDWLLVNRSKATSMLGAVRYRTCCRNVPWTETIRCVPDATYIMFMEGASYPLFPSVSQTSHPSATGRDTAYQ